jgi:hypothetical protein
MKLKFFFPAIALAGWKGEPEEDDDEGLGSSKIMESWAETKCAACKETLRPLRIQLHILSEPAKVCFIFVYWKIVNRSVFRMETNGMRKNAVLGQLPNLVWSEFWNRSVILAEKRTQHALRSSRKTKKRSRSGSLRETIQQLGSATFASKLPDTVVRALINRDPIVKIVQKDEMVKN